MYVVYAINEHSKQESDRYRLSAEMTYLATFALLLMSISYSKSTIYPIGAILVSNKYPRCKDVNLHTASLVCEIHSQEDEMKIERFGLSGCYGSTLSCAEGDIKTCMPLMTINNLHYKCYCHSDEKWIAINYNFYWSQWTKLNITFRAFRYKRGLIIDTGNEYLAEEYRYSVPDRDVYIVANYSLPDSVYSASSAESNHCPERARIDNYFNPPCSWAASDFVHPLPKISLPSEYLVTGVYIQKRCDVPHVQYPTMVDVMTSFDDVIWETVVSGYDITEGYSSDDETGYVKIWFSMIYNRKYWKVIISEYERWPSMMCDLLGYAV